MQERKGMYQISYLLANNIMNKNCTRFPVCYIIEIQVPKRFMEGAVMLKDRSCVDGSANRLCPCSFGVAIGVTKALCVVYLAMLAMYFGYGLDMVRMVASVYHGYAATFMGAVYGGLWALLDGFIFGAIVAMVYNCCSRCCCRVKNKDVNVRM
jgi:hypothetical protein